MDDMSELEWMYRNNKVLPWDCFLLVYGSNVYKYWAPDNTVLFACVFNTPVSDPYVKPTAERIDPPRSKDKVMVIEGDDISYGHIVYIDRDDDSVCCYMYNTKSSETWSLGSLETHREGRILWRIVL